MYYYYDNSFVPINQYDLATVSKHELGHSLGLCHSSSSSLLMYYATGLGERKYVGNC